MRFFVSLIAFFVVTTVPALAGPLHDAARQGNMAEITSLLDEGADIDEIALLTPLQMAALSGQLEAVNLLISRGADLEIASSTMGTALHASAQRGHTDVVGALLKAGANPDSRNSDQFTPLMVASLQGHLEVAEFLIEAGADIDAIGVSRSNGTGGNGKVNALHVASFKGDTEVAAALRTAGAGSRPVRFPESGLAGGDPELGRQLANKWCGTCYKIESEDEVIIKPEMGLSLVGVMGRPIASRSDYKYFPALSKMNGTWTPQLLYSFAVEPMLTVPGTRMRWNDGWTEEEVLHIIAYFSSVAN